ARLLTGAAVTCAAIALPVAALATAAASPPAMPPVCTSLQLLIWVGPGPGAFTPGGIAFYPVEFTNEGHRACSLDGYPRVSAISATGQQIGPAATPGGSKT